MKPGASWLTVNRRCNFRCKWCYAEGTNYETTKEMSFDLAKNLANTVRQIGVKNLLIIGGEPTLWRPLIEFNKFCAQEGFQTVLITNGTQFGIDSFWQQYRRYPNSKIALSLKASTPQQLYEVAGANNFEVVKKGISRALQEINAQASITYNKFYVNNLTDIVQFAVDCGAKSIKIDFCSTCFISGQPDATYMVDPKQLVKDIARDYPLFERIIDGHIVFEMMMPFCIWPLDFIRELKRKGQLLSVCHVLKRKGIIFDETGNVVMCNALFDYPIGRYGNEFCDGPSLLAWLDSSKIVNYYNSIGRYPSAKCATCDWYLECGGGCPLRWAIYKLDELIQLVERNTPSTRE